MRMLSFNFLQRSLVPILKLHSTLGLTGQAFSAATQVYPITVGFIPLADDAVGDCKGGDEDQPLLVHGTVDVQPLSLSITSITSDNHLANLQHGGLPDLTLSSCPLRFASESMPPRRVSYTMRRAL